MKMGYITATPSLSRTLTRSYVGRSAGLCCLRIYYDLYPIHTSCLRRSGGVLGSREDQDGIMPGQGDIHLISVSSAPYITINMEKFLNNNVKYRTMISRTR